MERWKLKRELSVLANQLASPVTFFTNRLQKRRYERTKAGLIRITEGVLPVKAEIAVFLIYQPRGVPESLLHTCRFLSGQGISPFIVANTPLDESDRGRLANVTWRIMERPNFGYDFGGYREGILHLAAQDLHPETLYLLNDSIWFPVFPDTDLIDRLRALPVDVASPVLARFKRRPGASFLHSYLMRFNRRALASEGFRRYWQDLAMSSNKMAVVRGGEKRLALRMQEVGLTTGAVWSWSDVQNQIATLPADEFRSAAEFAEHMYESAARHAATARLPKSPSAEERQSLVVSGFFGRDVLKAHPGVTVGHMGMPFVKKLRQDPFHAVRQALLRHPVADRLVPVVRAEIESWDSAPPRG